MPDTLTQPSYRIVHDGLLRLHELFLAHEERSEEAEEVRENSEPLWHDLPKDQRTLLSGLSKDLNDIKRVREQEQAVGPHVGSNVMRAVNLQHEGHYVDALELLRKERDAKPLSRISYYRGRNWQGLNEPRTALMFFNHAVKLAPFNALFESSALEALCEAFPTQGAEEVERLLDIVTSRYPLKMDFKPAPMVIVRACELKFDTIHRADIEEEEARPGYHKIAEALFWALRSMNAERVRAANSKPLYSVVYSLLGTSLEHLGIIADAFDAYTGAIGLDPFNAPLLIARGKMMYGRNEFAIEDFERAMQLHTDLAIPYYFKTHHLLGTGRPENAIEVADQGLKKRASKRLRSELLEFKAIAFAETGQPRDLVLRTFDEARKADESNERVDTNRRTYERDYLTVTSRPQPEQFDLKIASEAINAELPELPRLALQNMAV